MLLQITDENVKDIIIDIEAFLDELESDLMDKIYEEDDPDIIFKLMEELEQQKMQMQKQIQENKKFWAIHYFRDRGLSYYKGITANLEAASKHFEEDKDVIIGELCRDDYPGAKRYVEEKKALTKEICASCSYVVFFQNGRETQRLSGFPPTERIIEEIIHFKNKRVEL